ncbi:hypothetical protein DPQ33_17280 [Oceanidesulfovibrio indonesiensis]|uniref:Uncharacterized protein n=1 Tax=Oceanidesulfovibrio indonesiensis TaxID=54767 RepID=A0A7M3MAQ5_9BACT|nr:hypothetical protein [Oceanidesulfovibrio indonesiensis]TVM14534.1 hypothetical protein DPQ33_17280 [Oceanidesulfovibrio indonesiensis]
MDKYNEMLDRYSLDTLIFGLGGSEEALVKPESAQEPHAAAETAAQYPQPPFLDLSFIPSEAPFEIAPDAEPPDWMAMEPPCPEDVFEDQVDWGLENDEHEHHLCSDEPHDPFAK